MRNPDQIPPAGSPRAGTAVFPLDRHPSCVVGGEGHGAVLGDLGPAGAAEVGRKERTKSPMYLAALLLSVHAVLAPWPSTELARRAFPRVDHLVHESILSYNMLGCKGCYPVTNRLPKFGNTNSSSKWPLALNNIYIYVCVTLLRNVDRVRKNINRGIFIVPYFTSDRIRANPPEKGNAVGVCNRLRVIMMAHKTCYPGKGNESGGNLEPMGSM